jgi:hypothetical protein
MRQPLSRPKQIRAGEYAVGRKIRLERVKNFPLHVSVHIDDHLQGAHEQCFMPLTKFSLVDVHSLFLV